MKRPHLTMRRSLANEHVPPRTRLSPAALLGPDHPLARGNEFRRGLYRQSLMTAAAVVAGVIGTTSGRGWGVALLVVATVVLIALAFALGLQGELQRERAREVIIDGRDGLPLPALERERRRLQQRRRVNGLADALEGLVRAAEQWPTLVPTARPVFDPRQVRAASADLLAIGARLRAGRVTVRAVARVERLLTSGASPLYGRDPEALGDELRRIAAELPSVSLE